MRLVVITIMALVAIAAWADIAPRPPPHGGTHSIAFIVAGIVTASLIVMVRKLRRVAREDQAKTDNQVKSGMAKYSNCMDCPERARPVFPGLHRGADGSEDAGGGSQGL